MSDAQLIWNDFGADISLANGDIVPDNGLATSVLISLFTDGRATDEKLLPNGEEDKKGWWGGTVGSLLWLINREKLTQEMATRAREYCIKALLWLKEEEIAEKYSVETLIVKPVGLQIIIKIERGNAKRFSYLWAAVAEYGETVVNNTSIRIEFIE